MHRLLQGKMGLIAPCSKYAASSHLKKPPIQGSRQAVRWSHFRGSSNVPSKLQPFYPFGWVLSTDSPTSGNYWDSFFLNRLGFFDKIIYRIFGKVANLIAVDVAKKCLNGPNDLKKNKLFSKEELLRMREGKIGFLQMIGYPLYFPGEVCSSVPQVVDTLFKYLSTNNSKDKESAEKWQESNLLEADLRVLLREWKDKLYTDHKDIQFANVETSPCAVKSVRILRSFVDDSESLYFLNFKNVSAMQQGNGVEELFGFKDDGCVVKHGNIYYDCSRDLFAHIGDAKELKTGILKDIFAKPGAFKYAKIIVDFEFFLKVDLKSVSESVDTSINELPSTISLATNWFMPPFQRASKDNFNGNGSSRDNFSEPFKWLEGENGFEIPEYYDPQTQSVTPSWKVADFQNLVAATVIHNLKS